jgi:hypothetical protein
LDLFQAYTPLLYPITSESYWIHIELRVTFGDYIHPVLRIWMDVAREYFHKFSWFDAPLFTSEGFITSLILVVMSTIITYGKYAGERS